MVAAAPLCAHPISQSAAINALSRATKLILETEFVFTAKLVLASQFVLPELRPQLLYRLYPPDALLREAIGYGC